MNTTICCPLCKSSHTKLLNRVQSETLLKLHKEFLGFSPDSLFEGVVSLDVLQCINCGLKFYDPMVSGDSDYYGALSKKEWYYGHDGKSEFLAVQRVLEKGSRVLDIGSGIGRFSEYADGCVYTGIELSKNACEEAQRLGRNVIKRDLFELARSEPESFDVAVCFQVMEHITEPVPFCDAISKLVRSGGLIVIATPNNDSPIFANYNQNLNAPPHHVLLWNQQSLQKLAEVTDLDVVAVHKEELQDIHLKLYRKGVILGWLQKRIGYPKPFSFSDGAFHKIESRIVLLFVSIFRRLFPKSFEFGDGHSITIIMRKK